VIPVRTGLVGCGKVGQIHAAALRSLPEADFVAVCDASAERAQVFAGCYGTRAYADVEALLNKERLEAVLIGTPHPLHAVPAIRAAEAGVHVLVEKPMAASLADCDAMLASARKHGVRLGVISQRRFYEPVQRMKTAIAEGKIGRPWAFSPCIAGATRRITSPTPGGASGPPRAAASS
jgi:predicted dehydrogenase